MPQGKNISTPNSARPILSTAKASHIYAPRRRRGCMAEKRGKGYQTRANNILRQRMLDEIKRA
jgi:hypothetical protein